MSDTVQEPNEGTSVPLPNGDIRRKVTAIPPDIDAKETELSVEEAAIPSKGAAADINSLLSEEAPTSPEDDTTVVVAYTPGHKAMLQRQTRRWYLKCCIIFIGLTIIVVSVVVPILVLVVFPEIAQSLIDGSSVNFEEIDIKHPANESFAMHIIGGVKNTGPFNALIHFEEPVQVFWNDSILLGNITMTDINVSGGEGSIDTDVQFIISDEADFTQFTMFLLSAPSFTWRMFGIVSVSALGKTVNGLKLNKTVVYNGMNGFPDVTIVDLTLPVTNTPSNGIEIDITASLNNPSPLGIQLGQLNLNMTYQGTYLGPASVSDLFLATGSNSVAIKATLLSHSTTDGNAHVVDLLTKFINGIPAETISYGLSAYPDGQPVSWLTPAVRNLALKVNFAAPSNMTLEAAAKNFAQSSINGASLNFNAINITEQTATAFSSALDVSLDNTGPLPATMQFPVPVQIFYNGSKLGAVTMPSVNVSEGSGHLLAYKSAVVITDPTAFGNFTKDLLSADSLDWQLVGEVTAVALNRIFTGLTLNKTATLKGMGGFKDVQVVDFSLPADIPRNGGGIDIEITALLQNPSAIGIQLGTVDFNMSYQDVFLGPISAKNFFLQQGSNLVPMSGAMIPQTNKTSLAIVSQMFSDFINGLTLETSVRGVSSKPNGDDEIAWLEPGIESLVLTVPLNNAASKKHTKKA